MPQTDVDVVPPITSPQLFAWVQANLDTDLSLAALSRHTGRSPSWVHRTFKAQVGETPKQHVSRLRLESAALHLWLHRSSVRQVARVHGYPRHETFSRAFRRHFGVTPRRVRSEGLGVLPATDVGRTAKRPSEPDDFELSGTRIVFLAPMDIAFIRHVGPYESVDGALWDRLRTWASARGHFSFAALGGPPVTVPLVGIGHDAPGLTPADKLRFDAAIPVPMPFEPEGPIAHQVLSGGRFAMTTHVGSYATLAETYAELSKRIGTMDGIRPSGPPAIEMYHEARVVTDGQIKRTDIYLPVERV